MMLKQDTQHQLTLAWGAYVLPGKATLALKGGCPQCGSPEEQPPDEEPPPNQSQNSSAAFILLALGQGQ